MINKFLSKLIEKLEQYCIKNNKELHIGGTLEKDDIYMIRYPLFSSKIFTVYIHRFLRSDGEDHHDHPFSFWSYIAKGGYTEEVLYPALDKIYKIKNPFHLISSRRAIGSFGYRKGEHIHRVIVDQELKYKDRFKAPLTMIFFGSRYRTWGFWPLDKKDDYGVRSFIKWHDYLNIDPDSEKAKKHE